MQKSEQQKETLQGGAKRDIHVQSETSIGDAIQGARDVSKWPKEFIDAYSEYGYIEARVDDNTSEIKYYYLGAKNNT